MRMDLFPLTEFSKKNLEDCQKWRDENYETEHEENESTYSKSKFIQVDQSFSTSLDHFRFCRSSQHLHHALGDRLLWLLLFHLRNLSFHLRCNRASILSL